jgi:nitroreductase
MDLKAADELLTQTRSVRKRLDLSRPVPLELIVECIEIALQAPTGSNAQGWHFMVVTDAGKRAEIARVYKETLAGYLKMQEAGGPRWTAPGDPRKAQGGRHECHKGIHGKRDIKRVLLCGSVFYLCLCRSRHNYCGRDHLFYYASAIPSYRQHRRKHSL